MHQFQKDFQSAKELPGFHISIKKKKSYELSCVHIGEHEAKENYLRTYPEGKISFPLLVSCRAWQLTDSLFYTTQTTTGVSTSA